MLASVLWHVAIIWILILPIWGFLPDIKPTLAPVQIELTWYGEAKDLPAISLPGGAAKARPAARKAETPKALEQPAPDPQPPADDFHPRQTILSQPLHITHPRQTLIQPSAPAEPPKIAPPLPNIVQWPAQELAKPKLQYATSASAARVKQRAMQDVAAPDVANAEKNAGPINIAAPAAVKLAPQMPINARSARATTRQPAPAEAPAPEVASPGEGDPNLQRIIALSASPAPPSPNVSVPQGNLAARISASPEAGKSGAASGSTGASTGGSTAGAAANGANSSAAGASGSSPVAIVVSPPRAPVGNSGGTASNGFGSGSGTGRNGLNGGLNAGLGGGSGAKLGSGLSGSEPAARHAPGVVGRAAQPANSARLETAAPRTIDPNTPPEKILSGKEVYTLHANLPNLTSASGSWILNFAQLDEEGGAPFHPREELSGPEVLNTVDPKYPQTLIDEHVRGQVILYAIIRKDGSVDSIQLVQGLDPQLDRNAMQALAQWKFRPGKRLGTPVDLEAVIYIPFNYRSPLDYQSPTQ